MEFYKRRRIDGDTIILDNGAYEGHDLPSLEHYEKSITFYNPQVVVLPDFLLQRWTKTYYAAQFYLDQLYDKFPKVSWLYIPQALPGDLSGFIRGYHDAIEDRRITWLGIPRALAYAISDNPLARVEFARLVRAEHPGIKLHAFGMVNGEVCELRYLAKVGVTSIDSSAPVWRGWYDNRINGKTARAWWDEHGVPIDFSRGDCRKQDHEVILDNLEACGVDTSTAG
jgi:hypothetical protein